MIHLKATKQWVGKQQLWVTLMLGSPHGGSISLNICKKHYSIMQHLWKNNGQEIRAGS